MGAGAARVDGVVGVGAGAAVGENGLAVGLAGVSAGAPHSAFRKSFHFCPFRVPPYLAAWYFTEQSLVDKADAGVANEPAKASKATDKARRAMADSPLIR
ncbi:MAG: hypothetical protein EOO77_47565 [Oxalobacteraceae bacterium]|nr:MAG: hypothetical protein EOO77_47565 [Oxalobacteraceae bacterium]